MAPPCLISFNVDCIALSMVMMCCRNLSLCCLSCIAKVSSTCHFLSLGGLSAVVTAFSLNSSIYMLAKMELTEEQMAAPSTCL